MNNLSTLTVAKLMTKSPRSIEPHQTLKLAQDWMDELKVHHLPVRESGRVVGILSERDLCLAMRSKDASSLTVEDAMLTGVHSVLEGTSVEQAAREMLKHRVGSLLVLGKDGDLKGIFTDTDSLKILAGVVSLS